MIDERTADYITATAEAMSKRLQTVEVWALDEPAALHYLREDVAWLARQVAKLADGMKP